MKREKKKKKKKRRRKGRRISRDRVSIKIISFACSSHRLIDIKLSLKFLIRLLPRKG